jgi:hypothetical protein
MNYWPTYAHISAENRHAYLAWLADGKSRRDVELGYVFLYFFGLERRLITDRPSKDEALLLIAEVQRLLSIYGYNSHFHRAAQRLIATAQFLYEPRAIVGEPDPLVDEFTIDFQATLAAMCRDRKPISFAWAAIWDKAQVDRTNVWNACPKDLLGLAKERFEAAHPNGLVYRLPAMMRFRATYEAANRSVAANFDDIVTARYGANLPSVSYTIPPEIADCFKKSASQLNRYADFLVSHPGAESSPLAFAKLPVALRGTRLEEAEASFRAWLEGMIATSRGLVVLDELWSRLYGKGTWVYDKSSWEALAKQLLRYRYGLAPDPVFNDIPQLRPDQPVVFYRLDGVKEARATPSADFIAGQSVALICGEYVRISETQLQQNGIERLAKALETLQLSPAERLRIVASLPWCETQGGIRGRLKKTYDRLLPAQRPTVLKLAATVLNTPAADQVKLTGYLEKLSSSFGVQRTELYTTLHQTTGATAPVSAPASNVVPLRTGYKIPKPPQTPENPPSSQTLDPSRIASVIADTEEAFKALTVVFDEEEAPLPLAKTASSVKGLDQVHAELLAQLVKRPRWSRAEFEEITRALGLMADGAMETLNDWAFDQFDDALIEEGNPLELNQSCVEALSAGNAASASA